MIPGEIKKWQKYLSLFFSIEKLLAEIRKQMQSMQLRSWVNTEHETHFKLIAYFISTEQPSDNSNSLKIILVNCFIAQSTSLKIT